MEDPQRPLTVSGPYRKRVTRERWILDAVMIGAGFALIVVSVCLFFSWLGGKR